MITDLLTPKKSIITTREGAIALLIFIMSLFAHKIEGQSLTCTFSQLPTAPLYQCGSSLTCTITKNNLPVTYTHIEIYYPLQFDLINAGNLSNIIEADFASVDFVQTITVDDPSSPTSTPIQVALKRVRIPLSNFPLVTNNLSFIINTCQTGYENLIDINTFPMYFDLSAVGSTSVQPLPAIFSQQLQQFGSSGLLKFTSLLQSSPVLSNVSPSFGVFNYLNTFDRIFKLQFYGNAIENISITINQETDALNNGLSASSSENGNYTPVNGSISGYVLSLSQLQSILGTNFTNGLNTLYFKQNCSLECNGDAPVTSISAVVSCGGCNESIASNAITFNATFAQDLVYTASQTVVSSNNCFNNVDYQLNINIPAQNFVLGINYISFPFSTDDLTPIEIAVSGTLPTQSSYTVINPSAYQIENNGRIRINLFNQPDLNAWPGLLNNNDIGALVTTLNQEINFIIHVKFNYNLNQTNVCSDNYVRGISPGTQNFVQIGFIAGCLAESPVNTIRNFSLLNTVDFPNQNYVLSGGCGVVDLDQEENPNLLLGFNYNFSTSGNLNPLALYQTASTNPPFPLTKLTACTNQDLRYRLKIETNISSNSGENLFDFLAAYQNTGIEVIINNQVRNGVFLGNAIVITMQANEITLNNQISFTLDLDECPFEGSEYASVGFNGIATFRATIEAFCTSCPDLVRVLDCIDENSTGTPVDYLVFHCQGECAALSGGAGTLDFITERSSYGWRTEADFASYQIQPNSGNQPIRNATEFAAYTGLAIGSDELKEEIEKYYPYDLLLAHGIGEFTPTQYVEDIKFQIAHTPLNGVNGTSQSFLNLIPNTAFVRFNFANGLPSQTFYFDNLPQFNFNDVLSYGSGNNTISLNVSTLTFELDFQEVIQTLNALSSSWYTTEISLDFYALFSVVPESPFLTNPFNSANATLQNTIRGQFLTVLNNDPEIQKSCDSWAREIKILKPGVLTHVATETIAQGAIDLPMDVPNLSVKSFDCANNTPNLHSFCNKNISYGAYLFGGDGATHSDFTYEFRPFIKWPQSGSILLNGSSPNGFNIYPLYNAAINGYPISINNSSNFSNSNNALLPAFAKGWNSATNLYSGLTFSLQKDAPNQLVCNQPAAIDPLISINVPYRMAAYLHQTFSNPVYGSITPYTSSDVNNISAIQLDASQTLLSENNAYYGLSVLDNGLNQYDVCQRLRGSACSNEVEEIMVSDQFSFEFTFGSSYVFNPDMVQSPVWALCRFVDNAGQVVNISDFNFDLSTINTFNPTQIASADGFQKLLYFAGGLNTQITAKIFSSAPLCLPEGTNLEIIYGMFCSNFSPADYTNFFNSPSQFACFSCSRTILLNQTKGLTYTTNSSIGISASDCLLTWDIELQNNPENLTLTNTSLRFVLPQGLLLNSLDNATITLTHTDGSETTTSNLNFTSTQTFAGVSGGPNGDFSTVVNVNFNNAIIQPGDIINFQLQFVFSGDLCYADILQAKFGTYLNLYAFGVSNCSSSSPIEYIPIAGENFPVSLSMVPEILTIVGNPDNGCCKNMEVVFSTLGACPGQTNGTLNIQQVLIEGQDWLGSGVTVTIVNQNQEIVEDNIYLDQSSSIYNLAPGNYVVQVSFPFIPDMPFPFGYSSSQNFIILPDPASCPCDCEPGTFNDEIIIPANITTTAQFTQYLIDNEFYFPELPQNGIYAFPHVSNLCIKMLTNLIVDNTFVFDHCNIKVPKGREIFVTTDLLTETPHVLALWNGSKISGCDFMWKGINNSGWLIIKESTVEDAHYGVFLKRSDLLPYRTYLVGATFNNNFVALRTEDALGGHQLGFLVNSSNANNNITTINGGLLKLPYENQTPIPLAHSLAGIGVSSNFNLTVPSYVTFNDLCNGIVSHHSTVNVDRAVFNNINSYAPYTAPYFGLTNTQTDVINNVQMGFINGNGIIGVDNSIMNYIGGGLNSNATFTGCFRGIYALDGTTLTAKDLVMDNVTRGIAIVSPSSSTNEISNCKIRFSRLGIDLNIGNQGGATVKLNQLSCTVSHPSDVNYRVGIRVNAQNYGKNVNLYQNQISFAKYGIVMNAADNIIAENNTVAITKNTGFGLFTTSTFAGTIKCNSINGTNKSGQTAFYLDKSPDLDIINNRLSNTNIGFEIKEPCETDVFKLNRMENHVWGLNINNNGVLGHHYLAGNRFISNNNNTKAKTDNQTPIGGLFPTAFLNSNQTPAAFGPLVPMQFPNVEACDGFFFKCDQIGNNPTIPYCLMYSPPIILRSNFIRTASALANGDNVISDLTFAQSINFDIGKTIESKLYDGSLTLLDTGAMYVYKQNLFAGNARKLNEVDRQFKEITVDSVEMETYRAQIDSLYKISFLKQKEDSAYYENLDFNTLAYSNANPEKEAKIKELKENLKAAEEYKRAIYNEAAASAKEKNSLIVNTSLFDDLEQKVNDIYFETIGKRNYSLTSGQFEFIVTTANMCPRLGGDAVYKARSIYVLFNDTIEYDDELTCLQAGEQFRLAQQTKNNVAQNVTIFPNPTNDLLWFGGLEKIETRITIQITNMLGEIVLNTKLIPQQKNLNIANMASGVYSIKLFSAEGNILFADKFVKL